MKCTLYLQDAADAVVSSEIGFFTKQPDSVDIDEQNVVYEDGHYTGTMNIEDLPDDADIESIDIFLNGEIPLGRAYHGKNGYVVRFEDERGNETTQPFQLLYDLLVLSIRITYTNQSSEVLYSRYLASISKQPEDTQNAADMLKSLLHFQDEKIGDWMFGSRGMQLVPSSRPGSDNRRELQQPHTVQSPQAYIHLLESIVICYQANLQYFNTLARHSIKKKNVVQHYEKARDVSIAGFQWLMQNADQMLPVTSRTGLYHHGEYYIPNKILAQEPVSNRDVYENQVILSFLMLVLKNAQSVKTMLGDDIEQREATLQKIQSTVREGYQPPAISTIWQMPLKESKDFHGKLKNAAGLLESLYRKYNEILQCRKFEMKNYPRKTKTFQEVKPYSQVFGQIMKWFRFGGFDMKKNRIIFNLRTLDKLFEYFSLYKLLQMLTDAGFDAAADKTAVLCYEYSVPDDLYVNEKDVANTYHLEMDGCFVTLYYQPVIHSDRFENGLTLFRTTIPRRSMPSVYYTPDFLLKITRGKRPPVYVVLDSKYSNRLNILRRHADNNQTNYLDKMILKYSSQFASLETRESPKMIWVLQGRVGIEEKHSVFRFHNSPLSRRFPPKSNYGIISVNTKSDTTHELWNEIRNLEELQDD
ncbi:MAG: hypothetical protein LBT89_00810 [Planctomycetaceae bacterium]|jgi:hypothetical protein|nr:hypothetical protein [Planctomycetaceae bacterium]